MTSSQDYSVVFSTHDAARQAVLIVIPTYNEASNLERIVSRLRAEVPAAHVLVVDDASPDGTGELAESLAREDDQVHVMHRPGKQGLGAAYVAGFSWGLGEGFQVFGQMDADGSHLPEQFPALLASLDEADVVLGSRWVPGGEVLNWPWLRMALSRGGNAYVRLAMGLRLRDATGGYRVFRRTVLESIGLREVASRGYCFQVDVARRAVEAGFRVKEVPITFVEREQGYSKMSRSIVMEALWRVTVWGVARRLGRIPQRKRVAGMSGRP